ncbi:hypothetical protein ABT034_33670 [Streptomyces sp. NPDC002773]|uniref:hypothetical protein n=1 Tax=Streptomyces sp. NPDC002773 TaxID=3154430 RepID=UPI0033185A2D
MTAGVIPVIRCDRLNPDGEQCDRERGAPIYMPHHRALRAYLREQGWRRRRDGRALLDLCPDHATA